MYCHQCAANNVEPALACTHCGNPLLTASKPKATPSSTTLWSPDKAVFFSIFFTPIFGAIIHALNWRRLGQKSQAKQSWLWAAAIFIVFNVVATYGYSRMYDTEEIMKLLQLTQMIVIVGWYFLSARAQSKYVTVQFKDGYTKNSWFNPNHYLGRFVIAKLILHSGMCR